MNKYNLIGRRIIAFGIDIAIVYLIGLLIGLGFFNQLAIMDEKLTLLFGFTVLIGYSALGNSRFCDGKTLGKRLMGIKVINKGELSVEFIRSFGRSFVLYLPYVLSGIDSDQSWYSLISSVLVFGILLVQIYCLFFTTNAKRGIHDVLFGTFVVLADSQEETPDTRLERNHVIVCLTIVAVVIVLFGIVLPNMRDKKDEALRIEEKRIESLPGVKRCDITLITPSNDPKTGIVDVQVILQKNIKSYDVVAKQSIRVLSHGSLKIAPESNISMRVLYGYDLGIGSRWIGESYLGTGENILAWGWNQEASISISPF